jgi:hypothetical protein
MWRQNGSGCGHSARAPTGSPSSFPESSGGGSRICETAAAAFSAADAAFSAAAFSAAADETAAAETAAA